jgi:hypothetical protein
MRPHATDLAVANKDGALCSVNQFERGGINVLNTVCRSKAERLMTFRTSAVAVCWASDSSRSRVFACTSSNNRTFSIAITAWSAKLRTSSIARWEKWPGSSRTSVNAPTTASSRNIGTPQRAREPASGNSYSGRSLTSGISSTMRDKSTRPATDPRPGVTSRPMMPRTTSGCGSTIARKRNTSPSRTQTAPPRAPLNLTAEAISVSSTVCKSNAERLMTFNTSAVAVCWRSDSSRSRVRACTSSNKRTFSIAMTAWSAKVCKSSICQGVEWACVGAPDHQSGLDPVIAQQGDANNGTKAHERVYGNFEVAVRERVANGFRRA